MIFVTSDTHFFDEHLLGLTDFAVRPFLLASMMNETIIENWNEVVAPNDTVYHLGDIAVHFIRPESKSHQDVYDVLKRLNGNLVLIKGNHDNRALFKYLAKHNYEVNGKPKFTFHEIRSSAILSDPLSADAWDRTKDHQLTRSYPSLCR